MKKHNILVTVNGVSKSRAQWAKEIGVTKGAISHRESKGESASSAISGIIGTRHTRKILEHYAHAKKKHPYFCDRLLPDWPIGEIKSCIAVNLERARTRIKVGVRDHNLMWNEIADCEVWEATEAMANGDTAHAVEELYDCVAVLLRTIDVLEGRQKLGKPETKGDTK